MNFEDFVSSALKSEFLVVDVEQGETRGLLGMGLAFSMGPYVESTYIPLNHKFGQNADQHDRAELHRLIDNHPLLVCHNAKYDLNVLEKNGFNVRKKKFYDTMLMAHWIDENIISKDLDTVCRVYGVSGKNMPDAMKILVSSDQFGWDWVPAEMMASYSGNDAQITGEVFNILLPLFQAQGFDGELWRIEQEFSWLMSDIQNTGITVDLPLSIEQEKIGAQILSDITQELGINPGSRKGLEKLLLEELGLPILKMGKSGPSFDKKVMEQYDEILAANNNPLAKTILRYRGWQKTVTSNYRPYINFADANGRIHPNYKLHGTVTGRISCEKPNLQQIPRKSGNEWNGRLRDAFIPRNDDKVLVSFDASQLEFRLAAAYAKEESLLTVFNSSADIFTAMSEELGWLRDDVKTLTYTVLYGGGIKRICQAFNASPDDAVGIWNEYHSRYPGLKRKSDEASRIARKQGWVMYWSGRRRHFDKRDVHKEAHKAFNSTIQGGGFEIIKRAMLRAKELDDDSSSIVLQVHDEIVVEMDKSVTQEKIPLYTEALEAVPEDFGVKFKFEAKPWGVK